MAAELLVKPTIIQREHRRWRHGIIALGFSWDDTSGKNNGQYAPFNWRSA